MKCKGVILAGAVLAVMTTPHPALAQRTIDVTITEPAKYDLEQMFKSSDVVAVVKVISGDTESYNSAVYKAKVIRSFKGAKTGEILYFGPFIGERLGWEYVLFLQNAKDPLSPKSMNSPFGKVAFKQVFNKGRVPHVREANVGIELET